MSDRLRIVGVSGPIAAGKSLVTARLVADANFAAAIGGPVALIDADATLREGRRQPGTLRDAIVALHPAARLPDGSLDARLLADAAFGDAQLLARLEALQWPIAADAIAAAQSAAKDRGAALLLLEAIALLRSGLAARCDALLLIDAPRELRAARFVARGGSRADFDRRDAAQAGLADALRAAGAIEIDASGSPEAVAAAAGEAIRRVCFTGDDPINSRR